MKRINDKENMDKKKKLAEELVPIIERLPPEKRERVLGYAMGLADSKEMVS